MMFHFNQSKHKKLFTNFGKKMVVAWVFLAIYIACLSIPSSVWFVLHRNDPVVRARGWIANLCSSPPELYLFIVVVISDEVGIDCRAITWPLGAFFFPLWVGPLLIRGVKLYLDYKTAQSQAAMSSNSPFLKYKWINSPRYASLFMFLFLLLLVVISIPVYYLWPTMDPDLTQYGQCLGPLIFNVSIQTFVIMIFLSILTFLLNTVEDSYGIKTEFTCLSIISGPALVVWLVLQFAYQGSWGAFGWVADDTTRQEYSEIITE